MTETTSLLRNNEGAAVESDRRRVGHFLEEIYVYQHMRDELDRQEKKVSQLESALVEKEDELRNRARELYEQEEVCRIMLEVFNRAVSRGV